MPDPTRCTPHGAYFCERCRTASPAAAAVTIAEFRDLLGRVQRLEQHLEPTRCDHLLSNGLRCTREPHTDNGHVYTSSQTGDRHVGN